MAVNIKVFESKNFGDGVNKRFWEEIIQNKIENRYDKVHYITTGSIMFKVTEKSIILGSGFINKYADIGGHDYKSISNKKYTEPYNVISVRGPLSRQKLINFKIKCPENYGDPLILLPCIYSKHIEIKDNIVGIIPHYSDKNHKNCKLLKNKLEQNGYIVKYIDILIGDNYEKIIDEINRCKYIISSSLHGVIMGIIYKKKTIFLQFSDKVSGGCTFKFQDFLLSVNIVYKNINIYDVGIMNNIINVDYKYLKNLGIKLISLIPFINNERKSELINKYNLFYNGNIKFTTHVGNNFFINKM